MQPCSSGFLKYAVAITLLHAFGHLRNDRVRPVGAKFFVDEPRNLRDGVFDADGIVRIEAHAAELAVDAFEGLRGLFERLRQFVESTDFEHGRILFRGSNSVCYAPASPKFRDSTDDVHILFSF